MPHDHLINSLRYLSLPSTHNTKGLVHFQRQLSTSTATLIHIPVAKGHRVHLGFHGFQSFCVRCVLSSCSLRCHGFAPSDSLHMHSGVRRKSLELLRTLCIKSLKKLDVRNGSAHTGTHMYSHTHAYTHTRIHTHTRRHFASVRDSFVFFSRTLRSDNRFMFVFLLCLSGTSDPNLYLLRSGINTFGSISFFCHLDSPQL